MKKEILLSALLIATLAACTGKGPARKFKETAERLNQTYPIRLNETITIDSTHYNEKDNTVSYYYTVTGELDDPQFMDNNYATYKKALQEAIDNSVEMEEYRKFGSKIKYIYYSGSNKKKTGGIRFLNGSGTTTPHVLTHELTHIYV